MSVEEKIECNFESIESIESNEVKPLLFGITP